MKKSIFLIAFGIVNVLLALTAMADLFSLIEIEINPVILIELTAVFSWYAYSSILQGE